MIRELKSFNLQICKSLSKERKKEKRRKNDQKLVGVDPLKGIQQVAMRLRWTLMNDINNEIVHAYSKYYFEFQSSKFQVWNFLICTVQWLSSEMKEDTKTIWCIWIWK